MADFQAFGIHILGSCACKHCDDYRKSVDKAAKRLANEIDEQILKDFYNNFRSKNSMCPNCKQVFCVCNSLEDALDDSPGQESAYEIDQEFEDTHEPPD